MMLFRGKTLNDEIIVRQKHMGMTAFAVWIMIIISLQWTMLDMYLPALPILKKSFNVSEAVLNISVNAGIATTAIGTLVSGILSDKYGRKKLFIGGLLASSISALVCAASQGIVLLSIMRGIGGLGSGFSLTIGNAMLKDSFRGKTFQKYMTLAQSVSVIGPIIAPSLGSLIISISSWRFIFIFLAAGSFATTVPMFFSVETWPKEKRTAVSFRSMMKEVADLVRDRAFVLMLCIMGLLTIPVWAYISVSSYVYITFFGLSSIIYGVFYAFGSITSFFGPVMYIQLNKVTKTCHIVTVAVILVLAGGAELLVTGKLSPVIFLLGIIPLMLSEGIIRPLGIVVLLEEHSGVTGTASSLIQFVINVVGVIGTSFATLGWTSEIAAVGIISLACGVPALLCWILMVRKKMLARRLGL